MDEHIGHSHYNRRDESTTLCLVISHGASLFIKAAKLRESDGFRSTEPP